MRSQMRLIIVLGAVVVMLAVIAGVAYSAGGLNNESRPDQQQVGVGLTNNGSAVSNEERSRSTQQLPTALSGTTRNDP